MPLASMLPAMSRSPDSFYGWHVLFAAFTASFVANLSSISAVGAFVTSIEDEFQAGGAVSNAVGFAMLTMGVMGPIVGRAVDRGNQRAIMLVGAALMTLGLVLCSYAQALWQMGIAFAGVVIIGYSMCGPAPAVTLTSRWFVRRRGIAVAITGAAATVASGLSPVLAAFLIELEGVGWRGAILFFAAGCMVVAFPVLWLFAVKTPEELGQYPDGDSTPVSEPAPDGGYSSGALLLDRNFLVIGIGAALLMASPLVATVHMIAFAERELGIERQAAAFAITAFAACSLLGKFVFGLVADRFHPRQTLALAVVLILLGWVPLLGTPGYAMLVTATGILGLGGGALPLLHPILIGACFGRASFGHVMGLNALIGLPLMAGAVPIAGAVAGSQGYRAVFALVMVGVVVGGTLMGLVRLPTESALDDGIASEPA